MDMLDKRFGHKTEDLQQEFIKPKFEFEPRTTVCKAYHR